MAAESQLLLFPFNKPLLNEFGNAFFSEVPQKPGVYLMSDEKGRLLYIGQSKNLRIRLNYYKNAKPGREPKKVIRMLGHVKKLAWEECESARAALKREIQLLRALKPKFNKVNTGLGIFSYVMVFQANDGLEARIGNEPDLKCGEVFGPFKNRSIVRTALSALEKLCWFSLNNPTEWARIPIHLGRMGARRDFTLRVQEDKFKDFLRGCGKQFLETIERLQALAPTRFESVLINELLTHTKNFQESIIVNQ
ncbi:MAG: GIY-YIG nuclease family protein [Verrucomicrobiota bacterium]|nr:GIY-YIG nuclease family protein [Verrucomicrobiota bacterium]